ncbi:hypothetical protein H634G_11200 [Metarhizium anisopliae BRIP 53293]|uniref:DJ-1/PfpI domain-containing protein n=1 Tax=Metarhizium anisopliae BRIP 53293 TaxID=1291518 RepID=A0A0D9NHW5_METAN|nr:hypothetical protein H634G_11200 [Metarhizium anisopliae BRIP 53293]KJK84881.1 hypothetical protein H633G_11301 [Metarhizium anisopliae BRIP 53284]
MKNVLVVIFPGFNTMDMNGPCEVLKMAGVRDVPLDRNLICSLTEFNVLVVPGGPITPVKKQAGDAAADFMSLIGTFWKLPPRPKCQPRILLSICTGAVFLGIQGIFTGLSCTTHWATYQYLNQINQAAAGEHGLSGPVLQARFVDSGINDYSVRVISSGGVSCGLDASLYVVKLAAGEDIAREAADKIDYV